MRHRRADQVRAARVTMDRPGILSPFMQPMKMKNQVRVGGRKANLRFVPDGKTLVGGTQWIIEAQRPGLARPLIVAKKEEADLAKGLAIEARLATPKQKAKAAALSKAEATKQAALESDSRAIEKSVAAGGPTSINGYGNFYGAYGSYDY